MSGTKVFEDLESEVRNYCRHWPAVFSRAKGSHIYDEHGRDYLDFFAGAGVLNYGHNEPHLKAALLRYLQDDSIVHSLDMYTTAKRQFLEVFQQNILSPRGLDYKVQFSGPAGTIAVEAALKLARKFTRRRTVVSFTTGFHGMTLGALALTGYAANGPGTQSGDAVVLPYDQDHGGTTHGLLPLEHLLQDASLDIPAAVIVETVQGEGGMRTACASWLQDLARLCKNHEMLLIVDDIQMGCGRTGPFFSFEQSGIYPDIVCLSKSLSGYGLPLALTLLRPELDIWEPGEHSGTFRGPNPAFVTAVAALDFWQDETFEKETLGKSQLLEHGVRSVALEYEDAVAEARGRGMAWGIVFREPELARQTCTNAFERGLLVETNGFRRDVVKLMPPLTSTDEDIVMGLDILRHAIPARHRKGAMPKTLVAKRTGTQT
jgi:diaminobutyrate-2-oxoglutarate transaminase